MMPCGVVARIAVRVGAAERGGRGTASLRCAAGGSRTANGRVYRAAVRELLPDEASLKATETQASVVLGDVRVDQAQLPRLVEDGTRELHGAIVLCGDGHHLLLRKLARLPGGGVRCARGGEAVCRVAADAQPP
eukprot:scaffold31640_cov69-Phaeocystis_antarctica.AAC.1